MTEHPDTFEYCVMHPAFPDEPHRGPMPEQEARYWVAQAEKDGGLKVGMFYVARRTVGPWQPHPGRNDAP